MNFSLTGTMHTCVEGGGGLSDDRRQERSKQGRHDVEGWQADLTRRQPERPLACCMLAQYRNHALEGAEHGTVHDDGAVAALRSAA